MSSHSVFITGAGRGIGRATALRFAASRANIALMSRTASELEAVAGEVRAVGGSAIPLVGDVSSEQDVRRAIAAAKSQFGRIDVLVNSAGVAPLAPLTEMTTEAFDRLLAVNIRGTFLTCREVWPFMQAAKGGTIINISSMSARDPFPGFAAYGGSKAFVETFTRAIAAEGQSHNIRVYAVAPGAVETQMLRDLFPDYPETQTLAPQRVAVLIESLTMANCPTPSGETVAIKASEGV